jgi:hypothetical protein
MARRKAVIPAMPADALYAVRRFVETLKNLNIRYAVSGSFASSIYGVHRMSADCDLVALLRVEDVQPLVSALREEFYMDTETMQDAISRRGSFNLIHLETIFKIDVFIPANRPYDLAQIERRIEHSLSPESDWKAWFVSPEDCVLSKMEWYRRGREISDRQWADILGVIRVQSNRLDVAYLRRWGPELGVDDLLDKALHEAANP